MHAEHAAPTDQITRPRQLRQRDAIDWMCGQVRVELRPLKLHGSTADPVFFQGFIDEFAEIFEGLDESLPGLHAHAQRAAAQLRGLIQQGGTMDYQATVARGFR